MKHLGHLTSTQQKKMTAKSAKPGARSYVVLADPKADYLRPLAVRNVLENVWKLCNISYIAPMGAHVLARQDDRDWHDWTIQCLQNTKIRDLTSMLKHDLTGQDRYLQRAKAGR